MIAVLHSLPLPIRVISDQMRNVRRSVDGPFNTWRAVDAQDRSWRFYQVPEGIDSHYAAARIAARRGADRVIILAPALAAPSFLEEEGISLYEWVLPSRIAAMEALESVQRLMPNTATECPIPMPDLSQCPTYRTLESPGKAQVTLASLALPLTIPVLAEELYTEYESGLFDVSAVGAVTGAIESSIDYYVFAWVQDIVRPAIRVPRTQINPNQIFEDSFIEMMEQILPTSQTISRSQVFS